MAGLFFLLALFILLYASVFRDLALDWLANDNYSHGWFIPLLSGVIIYNKRQALKNISIRSADIGLPILLTGLLLLIVGTIGFEFFIQRVSLLVVLAGLILFLLGRQFFHQLLLPLVYLIFMIPLPAIIWNRLAFPLQITSSLLTEQIVSLAGIPVLREGNVLYLANTSLEVIDACSGLRSLITMFALAGALAMFSHLSTPGKWLLFFLAAPIAMLVNIIRLIITVLLATNFGPDTAHGFLHEFSGVTVYILGLLLLFSVKKWLAGRAKMERL